MKPDKKTVMSESEFLAQYDITKYERPSITTDIVALSMYGQEFESHRKDAEQKLSILLIKRGEHPFLGMWALPGGFLKSTETVEECAYREISEEANVRPVSLLPAGVFSQPDRDPRGRIVSNAFVSIISDENVKISGGDDAAAARWFDVEFNMKDDGICNLTLTSGNTVIRAVLSEKKTHFGISEFNIIENDGLAFDHSKIIATALSVLRKEADDFSITFDFLPEKFTLASLQRVHEILIGVSHLTANFRRKIADYVEETDEFTEGVGHRPARLFKRKL